MKSLKCSWSKKYMLPETARKNRSIAEVHKLRCINSADPSLMRRRDTVLITGDGASLPDDVKKFESWDMPHDVYCINRSMLYFQRPINHWAAVDAEESMWFAKYLNSDVRPNGHMIYRHTIGVCQHVYNVAWEIDAEDLNDYSSRIWAGNSGYFGILTAIAMGYSRIIIAGMPLDRKPHWYEPESETGPNWIGAAYTQWMDFKMKVPEADRVRSMSGYSAFILGEAKPC